MRILPRLAAATAVVVLALLVPAGMAAAQVTTVTTSPFIPTNPTTQPAITVITSPPLTAVPVVVDPNLANTGRGSRTLALTGALVVLMGAAALALDRRLPTPVVLEL